MISKNRGFKRLLKAVFYSYKGFVHIWKHEAAFRQEVTVAAVMIPGAFFLPVSHFERAVMIAMVVLVLIVELLNTGIEAVVDRVGFEHHELAGAAKDVGSAAVLVAILLCIFVWLSIVLPIYL